MAAARRLRRGQCDAMFAGSCRSVNLDRPMKSTLRRLVGALGALVAPPQCVLCDQPGLAGPVDLCAACLAELPRPAGDGPIPGGDFALVCCPWSFDFPVDALVRALKFHGERCHARLFGTLLARERARHGAPLPGLVIPVPLHPLRLRVRGYNQAAEIACYAARELALPLDRNALQRLRPTREQSALRHLLSLFDGQLDDTALHLEADEALMRLNVSGERELVGGRGLFGQARIEIDCGGDGSGEQNHDRYQSFHGVFLVTGPGK